MLALIFFLTFVVLFVLFCFAGGWLLIVAFPIVYIIGWALSGFFELKITRCVLIISGIIFLIEMML